VSERKYTTVALNKVTYSALLSIQHVLEVKLNRKMSFSDVVKHLCDKWGGD
jgi:hypothetical protein